MTDLADTELIRAAECCRHLDRWIDGPPTRTDDEDDETDEDD